MKLNMFRATHGPSSGALNFTSSLWFCICGGLLGLQLLDAVSVQQLHAQQPSTYAKPKAASAVLGSWWWAVSPETCSASYEYEIKFWYTVASCQIFFVNYNNLQLHVTWKLTAISLQQNTFQKPRNQASAFHLNCSCQYGYTSGLKTVLQNS